MTERDAAPHASAGSRREFLALGSTLAMGGGLAVGYGTLGVMAGQFLYPAGGSELAWQYVARVDQLIMGESIEYTSPAGIQVVVARQSEGSTSEAFIALSSICPHLGCKVHWESQQKRFFCPCHNGAFDAQGQATLGPPAKARQQLVRFPLKVDDGLLFIEVPMESMQGDSLALAKPAALHAEGVTT